MKVLYITSEASPFIATGGLADVAAALPKALCKKGVDCRVVLPLYSGISPALRKTLEFVKSFNVPLGWRNQYCGLFTGQVDGVTYYLLDNEYYFKRPEIYGWFDDGERFAFFAKAALEMIQYLDFLPDVLHCNDWQSALVPPFLELFYQGIPQYQSFRTVFTIHNIQYQGKFGKDMIEDVLGISQGQSGLVEYEGCVNFMKGAIVCSHAITTVSTTYAQEILHPWYSYGLDSLLLQNRGKLSGILNGIDTDVYNPQTDPNLYKNYSSLEPAGKLANKVELQTDYGLERSQKGMLLGMVTRLTEQKGMDLVIRVLEDILAQNIQVIVLGNGDRNYEEFFECVRWRYPGQMAFVKGFIPALARKIYAGADVFLMPSKSEPCGLAQMVALRYGAIPIVRETGGLRDSIVDVGGIDGNGYTFQSFNAHHMLDSIGRAHADFLDRDAWEKKVLHAMSCDFSWNRSAEEYERLYLKLV